MHIITVLAVIITTAGYLGLVPEAAAIGELPLPLLAGSIITFSMLYVFARS